MKFIKRDNIYASAAFLAFIIVALYTVSSFAFMRYGFFLDQRVVNEERRDKVYEEYYNRQHEENGDAVSKEVPLKTIIFYRAINFIQFYVATFLLFIICLNILFKMKASVRIKTTLMLIACIAWISIYSLILIVLKNSKEVAPTSTVITIRMVLGMAVLLSSLLHYYVKKDHETAIENERLKSMYYSTQYEALRSKLDPHFLFNALNTLSGLIAINSEHIKEYIQKLSTIFRVTLKHEDVTLLEDELRFASSYGDLMTIRYEDALTITYDIPEEMKGRKVVSFSIQSLLENVIKHNTITKRHPMQIEVRSEDDYVVVSNPIHPRHEREESNGLGLKMLAERSTALLKKNIIIGNDNGTFTVKVPTA